ncbi:hypothetical protein URH17368_0316 [Alicyclobacillus hesperidum URH17-3-68]|nr:hypothetical protein URH17368_0316 [Alicyclobacillus hesperidum URH17-3-68]
MLQVVLPLLLRVAGKWRVPLMQQETQASLMLSQLTVAPLQLEKLV